jgi:hypothetical protein
MLKYLKQQWFEYKLNRAIEKANRLHKLTKYKYLVIYIRGKLKVIPKKTIKQFIAAKYFKQGITIAQLEKKALYIT